MRKLTVLLVLLLIAGCGGTASETSTTAQSSATTVAEQTVTTAEAPGTTQAEAEAMPEGPPAPEFQLELADGSTFALSAAEKPIYMVFWAEW